MCLLCFLLVVIKNVPVCFCWSCFIVCSTVHLVCWGQRTWRHCCCCCACRTLLEWSTALAVRSWTHSQSTVRLLMSSWRTKVESTTAVRLTTTRRSVKWSQINVLYYNNNSSNNNDNNNNNRHERLRATVNQPMPSSLSLIITEFVKRSIPATVWTGMLRQIFRQIYLRYDWDISSGSIRSPVVFRFSQSLVLSSTTWKRFLFLRYFLRLYS